jgi:hypothetical protein
MNYDLVWTGVLIANGDRTLKLHIDVTQKCCILSIADNWVMVYDTGCTQRSPFMILYEVGFIIVSIAET